MNLTLLLADSTVPDIYVPELAVTLFLLFAIGAAIFGFELSTKWTSGNLPDGGRLFVRPGGGLRGFAIGLLVGTACFAGLFFGNPKCLGPGLVGLYLGWLCDR